MGKIEEKWGIFQKWIVPKIVTAWTRVLNVATVILRLIIAILVIVAGIAFFVVPFLNSILPHKLAQWIWYPSSALFILYLIIDTKKNGLPIFKTPEYQFLSKWGTLALIPTVISMFVIRYYDIDYAWCWVIFALIAVYIPFYFIALLDFGWKRKHPNAELKSHSGKQAVKFILLYWLYDLLYMAIFNDWTLWIFVFGTLTVIAILVKSVQAFLAENKVLQFMLPVDFLLGVGLSVYLIYIIPDTYTNLQTIVTTIAAAVYGGLITLVGVAWTIKKNKEEQDEKDLKQNTPYLCMGGNSNPAVDIIIGDGGSYFLTAQLISDAIFIFRGAILDGKFVSVDKKLIPPKSTLKITLNIVDNTTIALVGSDVLGNDYCFDLDFYIKAETKTRFVKSIGLPIGIIDLPSD